MKNIFRIMASYIKSNIIKLIVILASFAINLIVFSLYSIPLEAVAYASFLVWIFILLVAIIDFILYYKKHKILKNLSKNLIIPDLIFNTHDLIEKDYQEIIKAIDANRSEIINSKDLAYSNMIEYYTIWVHQIKTPISAMRLLLQSEPSALNCELEEQLFKIEQYVEMVLYYQRLDSISSDFLFKKYDLHDIVKQALKKNSMLFISSRLSFDMQPFSYIVITDEKWLQFVIGQILSNAVKYTPAGGISIHAESSGDTVKLIIEDTGIGIRPEDLPRIFERGFTGYNGRLDKKSTGIGLYLCKKILDKLSHTVEVTSEYGKGTRVTIGIAKEPELFP